MSKKPTNEEQETLPPLSDRDRDQFLEALDRPVRRIPEAIHKAMKRREELIVSDVDTSDNGQKEIKVMIVDPDQVFSAVERLRSAGLPIEKTDYDEQARRELIKLKESLGHKELSDDEFISLYKQKVGIGH
jgi:hypothetical protein